MLRQLLAIYFTFFCIPKVPPSISHIFVANFLSDRGRRLRWRLLTGHVKRRINWNWHAVTYSYYFPLSRICFPSSLQKKREKTRRIQSTCNVCCRTTRRRLISFHICLAFQTYTYLLFPRLILIFSLELVPKRGHTNCLSDEERKRQRKERGFLTSSCEKCFLDWLEIFLCKKRRKRVEYGLIACLHWEEKEEEEKWQRKEK